MAIPGLWGVTIHRMSSGQPISESTRGKGTSASADGRPWTTRRLLTWMADFFESKNVDSPRLVAEMLLSHVIGCERMRLYMEADRPASPLELATLRDLVRRAGEHEPVQYLVGHGWFFGKQFEVSRATLIPRPSTEALVEHVLDRQRVSLGRRNPLIADLGTGTGCIVISLALHLKGGRFVATDIVPEVIELAKKNATTHEVDDRIEFRLGRGLDPLRDGPPGQRFDYIVANLPYVSDAEWEKLDRNVKEYEPSSALRGGADGMDIIGPIIDGAANLLAPEGQLVMEIGHHQREIVLERIKQTPLRNAHILKDHEGYWRVLVAERGDG
jgi:release factor glutamine methyltransferase